MVSRTASPERSGCVLVVSLLAFLSLLGLSIVITRSLTTSVQQAADAASRLAEGDLEVSIATASNDEVGQLLRAMGRMVGYFQEISAVADRIAQGDVAAAVPVRSDRDRLGRAFLGDDELREGHGLDLDEIASGPLVCASRAPFRKGCSRTSVR